MFPNRRGAAMSLTAAAAVLLFSLPAVLGESSWGVTYTDPQLCGLKGSAVNMSCTYSHPSQYTVDQRYWLIDGKEVETIPGRVEEICDDSNTCTLRITDLRESDRAKYRFRFETKPTNAWSGGEVPLKVTGLTVQVKQTYSDNSLKRADLECQTSCNLPNNPTFIWYKNGGKIKEGRSPQANNIQYEDGDSVLCAVRGHEDLHSPSLCLTGGSCNHVTYTERNICAFKGSSVDISCTYNSYYPVKSKFWFSPGRGDQWENPSQPEDLREDPQYAGRVQLLDSEGGRSTLRITELRESDAAQYGFKFTTSRSEWKSDLPATTVTVTDVQMQVTSTNVTLSQTEAELKCLSSCSPAGPISFVWVKNGQKYQRETFSGWFSPGDEIYCALAGHEDYRSPTLYVPVVPSVTPSVAPDEIIEGRSVTLTCGGNGATVKISWYKKDGNTDIRALGGEPQLVFESIKSSDSGEYYCRAESQLGNETSNSTLVDVQYPPRPPSVSVTPSGDIVEGSSVNLTCSSDANPAPHYSWYKENQKLPRENLPNYYFISIGAEDTGIYYCKSDNQLGWSNSSQFINVLYPPRPPSVSVTPSGDIVEGSSVNLTCSSDANPAPHYSWYKENQKLPQENLPNYHFISIGAEDTGIYYCKSDNQLGWNNSSQFINVLYPPRLPSIVMVPSGDIVEGESVYLTCNSAANPAASYSWFKEDQKLPGTRFYHFSSISAEHKGMYHCKSENSLGMNSSNVVVDVQYPPGPPSVSMVPSGDIPVGSTVTLTCSSDANPAANYSWFKEIDGSPRASGRTFIITSFSVDHSGDYYCEATNSRGSQRVSFNLPVVSDTSKYIFALAVVPLAVFLIAPLVWLSLQKRAKKDHKQMSEHPEKPGRNSARRPSVAEEEDIQYASINFIKTSADLVYSNITTVQPRKHLQEEEDNVEYSSVKFNTSAPRNMSPETVEDVSALYSTVNKTSQGPGNDR